VSAVGWPVLAASVEVEQLRLRQAALDPQGLYRSFHGRGVLAVFGVDRSRVLLVQLILCRWGAKHSLCGGAAGTTRAPSALLIEDAKQPSRLSLRNSSKELQPSLVGSSLVVRPAGANTPKAVWLTRPTHMTAAEQTMKVRSVEPWRAGSGAAAGG